jgi:hypothetical protein
MDDKPGESYATIEDRLAGATALGLMSGAASPSVAPMAR